MDNPKKSKGARDTSLYSNVLSDPVIVPNVLKFLSPKNQLRAHGISNSFRDATGEPPTMRHRVQRDMIRNAYRDRHIKWLKWHKRPRREQHRVFWTDGIWPPYPVTERSLTPRRAAWQHPQLYSKANKLRRSLESQNVEVVPEGIDRFTRNIEDRGGYTEYFSEPNMARQKARMEEEKSGSRVNITTIAPFD